MPTKFFPLLLFLFATLLSSAQKPVSYQFDANLEPPDQSIDVIHLKGEIFSIDPYRQEVKGKATFTFKPLIPVCDSIVLTVPEIKVEKVLMDGVDAKIETRGSLAVVFPEKKPVWERTYTMVVYYQAHPTTNLYFSGWNDTLNLKRKQIWAHDPSHWLPFVNVKQDVLTTELLVTFDKNYQIASNGIRKSVKENPDGTKTWHYLMTKPHVIYLVCLVIGDYRYKEMITKRGLPLEYWYYPDQENRFEVAYKHSKEMFEFLEEETGLEYPYELYRQMPVQDYLYGGMETTTATVFGDYMFVDQRGFDGRNYINVNVHELTHQWFGNYISHLNGRHTWLTESFATYYAKKFEQYMLGENQYQYQKKLELDETLEDEKKNLNPILYSGAGRAKWYPKGSLVMDMLRDYLGEEPFRKTIHHYLRSHPYDVVETNDFLKAIRETTGQSADWFFEQWIYRGGMPYYEVKFTEYDDVTGNRFSRFSVDQIHETNDLIGLYSMPFEFLVVYSDGSKSSQKQWISRKNEIVLVPNPDKKSVEWVIFDPGRKIMKQTRFEKPVSMWLSQAAKGDNMLDRYDALIALRSFSMSEKRKLLTDQFSRETFHLNKSEIISQLAGDHEIVTINLLRNAINDPDPFVRRAVLQAYSQIPGILQPDFEKLLSDSSYINVELALGSLCASFPENTGRYLEKTAHETGWRGKNIRIKWLELAVQYEASARSFENLKELISCSGISYEFETRMNAINALQRLNYLDAEVTRNLLEASVYWNFKLADVAKNTLKYFYRQNRYKMLIEETAGEDNLPQFLR